MILIWAAERRKRGRGTVLSPCCRNCSFCNSTLLEQERDIQYIHCPLLYRRAQWSVYICTVFLLCCVMSWREVTDGSTAEVMEVRQSKCSGGGWTLLYRLSSFTVVTHPYTKAMTINATLACSLRGWIANGFEVRQVWQGVFLHHKVDLLAPLKRTIFVVSNTVPEEDLKWGYSLFYDAWTHTWTFLVETERSVEFKGIKQLYEPTPLDCSTPPKPRLC